MDELRLFHLSDLHIGVRNRILGESGHVRRVLKELEKIIDRAVREDVRFILITGDIFDSNRVIESYVNDFFSLLAKEKGVNFILIPGGGTGYDEGVSGHDAYVPGGVYLRPGVRALMDSLENVYLLTPRERILEMDDVVFSAGFFDYAPVVNRGRFRVALMHGAYGNRDEYGEKDLPPEFLSSFDYVALGHYHSFSRPYPNAAYPGALIQFEFIAGKSADGGYLDVVVSNNGLNLRYEKVDSPGFLLERVLSSNDLQVIRNALENGDFVRVTAYFDDFEEELSELKKKYSRQLEINENGLIDKSSSHVINALSGLMEELSPEYRSEVEEVILFSLLTSPRQSEFERFLKRKFELED